MAKLNNWSVVCANYNPYQPPECQTQHLHGIISGRPEFPDGVKITTTIIQSQRAGCVVTKSGTMYELGDIDPQYEQFYPNARARLFATLPEST